ncbi:MAG: hypothetical protein A2017_15465 [Lentisphaerae bacterium GWF2_44_16]|nr:MAG: hypothetical protein A2017_15465 [Lentisphaerae bacterium GWF2_44_16]
MSYNFNAVADIVDKFALDAKNDFKLEDVFLKVSSSIKVEPEDNTALSRDIESILDESEILFKDGKKNLYVPRTIFFKKAEFLVTPTEFEIKNGILFPGHRFSPFKPEFVFPSQIKITDKNSKKALVRRDFQSSVEDAAYAHYFMGIDDMNAFFIADNQKNYETLRDAGYNLLTKIELSVFELSDFYREHEFKNGDALKFTVSDWFSGKYTFACLKASERKPEDNIRWITSLETALEMVFDQFADYIEIHEQFARAFFIGDRLLLENPVLSLDEFCRKSENVNIAVSEGRPFLVNADSELFSEDEIPEDVMISKGNTSSLDEMLTEIACPLSVIEIESCIYNELFEGVENFESFYEHCFSDLDLEFADDAQRAVFQNFLEDSWESISEDYNRFSDEDKGRMRSRIIEIVYRKRDWLNGLKQLSFDVSAIPKDKMEALAGISVHLASFLRLLNSDEKFSSEEEIENTSDMVENLADMQGKLISEINKALSGAKK